MTDDTGKKLHSTAKMIHAWTPDRDRIYEATAHLICLVEELGEAIEVMSNPEELLRELADVIISANMVNITLTGKAVRPEPPAVAYSSFDFKMRQLSLAVCQAAAMWRQLSGMRARASRNPASMGQLEAQLAIVVGRAYAVNPHAPLDSIVLSKLDEILERGAGLSTREAPPATPPARVLRDLPTHTGGKPGTVHMF